MKVVDGKNGYAKIFTDQVEETAIEQIKQLCAQPWIGGANIRIMPDVHAGAGCTIGTTMKIKDIVVPNLVGVDIGCGMEVVNIGSADVDFVKLDRFVRKKIPSGFSSRGIPHQLYAPLAAEELDRLRQPGILGMAGGMERVLKSVGTLGGGNHFIEVNQDSEGELCIVIHSGSRNFGLQVANYYQAIANERQPYADKDLAFLTGTMAQDYMWDMEIAQRFAQLNRQAMMIDILDYLESATGEVQAVNYSFTTIHNYIETAVDGSRTLRKGAVSAKAGERFIVPINMRDGSLICEGKGNPDWNMSAPHGAGRLMSRGVARRQLSVDDFKSQMSGIYSTSVNASTLDESPMAYKDAENIINNIEPTAKVVEMIKPLYNFKAAERSR